MDRDFILVSDNQDHSLESQITEGVVQIVDRIVTDLTSLIIEFVDVHKETMTRVEFRRYDKLHIQADDSDDMYDLSSVTESLIGIDYIREREMYFFTIRTDNLEVSFVGPNLPTLHKGKIRPS